MGSAGKAGEALERLFQALGITWTSPYSRPDQLGAVAYSLQKPLPAEAWVPGFVI